MKYWDKPIELNYKATTGLVTRIEKRNTSFGHVDKQRSLFYMNIDNSPAEQINKVVKAGWRNLRYRITRKGQPYALKDVITENGIS